MTFKIVRNFTDKKTGLPHAAQYGPTVATEKSAADLLVKIERAHPGYVFEVSRG
jgi:hypothetical protein